MDALLLLTLFVGALLWRVSFITATGFDGLYGQDAYAYFDFGKLLAQGEPLPPFFWPLGYPLVLALGFKLFGLQAVVGQGISLVMGAALAPGGYWLARLTGCRPLSALIAGAVLLVCGQAVQSSMVLMSDIPALFWALMSSLCLLVTLRRGDLRWLIAAAVLLAFAVMTRWLYLTLIIPWGGIVLGDSDWRLRWKSLVLAAGIGLLILLPQLLFSLSNPYPALNHEFTRAWSPENALQRTFTGEQGAFTYEQMNVAFYARPLYEPYYLSPVFLPLVLFGAFWLRRRSVGWLLMGWCMLPYIFLVGIPSQNIRFALIGFPAVSVLAASGAEGLLARFEPQRLWLAGGVIVLVAVTGIFHMIHVSQPVIETFLSNQQRDKAVVNWAARFVPPESRLYIFELTLPMQHYYPDRQIFELYYETPESLEAKWMPGEADYLLLNGWVVVNQWAGLSPQIAYHWLRDQRGLTQIGRKGNYTLFKVAG